MVKGAALAVGSVLDAAPLVTTGNWFEWVENEREVDATVDGSATGTPAMAKASAADPADWVVTAAREAACARWDATAGAQCGSSQATFGMLAASGIPGAHPCGVNRPHPRSRTLAGVARAGAKGAGHGTPW